MSITIVYLLLCLIPNSGIQFSWGTMILFWLGKFLYDITIGVIVSGIKWLVKKSQGL